jgi:hypothetical protein
VTAWTVALFLGYLTAVSGWIAASRVAPDLWRPTTPPAFARPWLEIGLALLAVVGVLLLGQLWVRGIRFPAAGPLAPFVESVNQLLIFSPILLLPLVRRQSYETALLRKERALVRVGIGVVLAAVALAVHVGVRRLMGDDVLLVPRVLRLENVDVAFQVLFEDVAVAILLVRLAAAIGTRPAVVAAASLFAAGHIPSMLARGANLSELAALVRDVTLGLVVLGTVLRSSDILWFWPVHVTMDLTQFARVMGTEPH